MPAVPATLPIPEIPSLARAGCVFGLLLLSACAAAPTLPEGEQVAQLLSQGFQLERDGRDGPGASVLVYAGGNPDAVLTCTDAEGATVPAGPSTVTAEIDGLTIHGRQEAQVDARVLVDDDGSLSGDYYYTVRRILWQGRKAIAVDVENHHFGPADAVTTKTSLVCRRRA